MVLYLNVVENLRMAELTCTMKEVKDAGRNHSLIPYSSFRYVPDYVTIAHLRLQSNRYGDFKVFSISLHLTVTVFNNG
ncbi:hypothetical protein J6590_080180 [Homalodisca vitripennis]|nr:hypothetical protein J6590_080180 [Homalodisca vitripennis]